jgi:hypothetical protein
MVESADVSMSEDEDQTDDTASATNVSVTTKELDAVFEKDLCDLWDMSVEREVCVVLDEFNAIQIFEGFMRKYDDTYPRAIEILIGIIYNMASLCSVICLKLVNNKQLINYLLFNILCRIADVPTVVQAVRLFTLFLLKNSRSTANSREHFDSEHAKKKSLGNETIANDIYDVAQVEMPRRRLSYSGPTIKRLFIEYLKTELDTECAEMAVTGSGTIAAAAAATAADDSATLTWQIIIEKFYFILEQSLNPTLIDCTNLLLINLLDADDEICNAFCMNHRIVDALCNATLTRAKLDRMEKTFTNSRFTNTVNGYVAAGGDDAIYLPSSARRIDSASTKWRNGENETPSKLSDKRMPPPQSSAPFPLETQDSQEDISYIDNLFNKCFLCLQTLSTCELGVSCLCDRYEAVVQLFDDYLEKCSSTFNDWEIKSSHSLKSFVCAESLENFVCLLSVLNCIFTNQSPELCIDVNSKYFHFFQKLLTLCNYYLNLFDGQRRQIEDKKQKQQQRKKKNCSKKKKLPPKRMKKGPIDGGQSQDFEYNDDYNEAKCDLFYMEGNYEDENEQLANKYDNDEVQSSDLNSNEDSNESSEEIDQEVDTDEEFLLSEAQKESFSMAKSNMDELFKSIVALRNEPLLSHLYNSCIRLLKQESNYK